MKKTMYKPTKPTKSEDIKRFWHLVDLKDKILGRIASNIAQLLMGKSKPYFTRSLDVGDYVVVVNAKGVAVSGNKKLLKKYRRHSGFPGGFKEETLGELRSRKPERIIYHAVSGMLPQNKLRDRMLSRLFIFAGEEHPYKDKINPRFNRGQKSKVKNTD